MTHKLASALLIMMVVTGAAMLHGQVTSRGSRTIAHDGASIDQLIAAFMEEHDVAGLSVAIVQAPYVTRATGFGVADTERRTLVSARTMFDVAGMRSAFTGVALMQLVEDGKLQLDAVVPRLRNPANAAALEALVEQASGQSYEAFVRARQFEPLALKHTFFGRELDRVAREALAPGGRHQAFLRTAALIDPTEPARGYRGSTSANANPRGIYSSAHDVSIWDIGLAGDILIKSPELRKVLYDPPLRADGTKEPSTGPWYFPGHRGLMISTGSSDGFSSLLSRFTAPDELVCVTLLANREGLDLTQLARRIAGAYNTKIGPPASARGMRVQQSPYPVAESLARLERALRGRGVAVSNVIAADGAIETAIGRARVWREADEVWLAMPDPTSGNGPADPAALARRATIDAALLDAILPRIGS